jgi:transposase
VIKTRAFADEKQTQALIKVQRQGKVIERQWRRMRERVVWKRVWGLMRETRAEEGRVDGREATAAL